MVFLPGKVRISQIVTGAGSSAGPGATMQAATSTDQVVKVSLTTDQRSQVHAGDPVEITLPGTSRSFRGRVREVGTVATASAQANGARPAEARPPSP